MGTGIASGMVLEFKHESEGSRKLLERIPEDRLSFKPHEKSMSLARLATHLAEIPSWSKTILDDESFDMAASEYKPIALESRAGILELFEKNRDLFVDKMSEASDEHLFKNWKLSSGDHAIVDMPRVACIRSFILSHAIHHRGQLTVYLRLNDVPLPGLYGPSADES